MEASTILYESVFCRLCGIKNTDGVQLFLPGQNGGNLSQLVNKYLPLQVRRRAAHGTQLDFLFSIPAFQIGRAVEILSCRWKTMASIRAQYVRAVTSN